MDGTLEPNLILGSFNLGGQRGGGGTLITPQGWIFLDHILFIIFKSTHQYLSNEGSNFNLCLLEVGHFLTNYQKLQIWHPTTISE
jgi:hypothetical protein